MCGQITEAKHVNLATLHRLHARLRIRDADDLNGLDARRPLPIVGICLQNGCPFRIKRYQNKGPGSDSRRCDGVRRTFRDHPHTIIHQLQREIRVRCLELHLDGQRVDGLYGVYHRDDRRGRRIEFGVSDVFQRINHVGCVEAGPIVKFDPFT